MSKVKKDSSKEEQDGNSHSFQKLVTVCLLGGIIILSGLTIFYVLNPEPGYFNVGILNSEKKAQQYPTRAKVREKIEFYVTVENELKRDFTFQIRVLLGDANTELTSNGSQNARLRYTVGNITLANGQKWISNKLWVSFYQAGKDQKIIIELWEVTSNNQMVFQDILWLRLDIIAR